MREMNMQKTVRNAANLCAKNSAKCAKLKCKKQCEMREINKQNQCDMRSEFCGVFCIEIWRIFSAFFQENLQKIV